MDQPKNNTMGSTSTNDNKQRGIPSTARGNSDATQATCGIDDYINIGIIGMIGMDRAVVARTFYAGLACSAN